MNVEIIKDIRKQCRMAMNGVTSKSMREYGLDYKLNFGVSIHQIKEIASRYEADSDLAEELWNNDTRELKILATMLYPQDKFVPDVAKRWIEEISNQEIREQLTVNLLQHLSYIQDIAVEIATSDDKMIRTSAYWILSRYLIVNKHQVSMSLDSFSYLWEDIVLPDVSLRNAALLFLKNVGKTSKDIAGFILNRLSVYQNSKNPFERESLDSLSFEFEFYFE